MAGSGAVAGLCPLTEASLGDGIFEGVQFAAQAGTFGVGTDSNIQISVQAELQMLEYSQRLRDRRRAIYANEQHSTGRVLYDTALAGGASALSRNSGAIKSGCLADLVALDENEVNFSAVKDDGWLDAWIFACGANPLTDVWSAGRHVVSGGRHKQRADIESAYRSTMRGLMARL